MIGARWGLVGSLTALFLWVWTAIAASAPLDVHYDLDVAFSPLHHTVGGRARITIINRSETPLRDVMLALYPNIYRVLDPALTRAQAEVIYPRDFNPGSLRIDRIEAADGSVLEFSSVDYIGPQKLSLIRVFLPRLLEPGGSADLRIAFTTTIPEKFGVFGYFHDVTILKGGWYPYVPAFRAGEWIVNLLPDPARFTVRITAPQGIVAVGARREAVHPSDTTAWIHRSERSTSVVLALSPDYQERIESDGPTTLRYFSLPGDHQHVGSVMDTLHRGLAFYRREYGKESTSEILLAEAHLHQEVVSPHGGAILVSTRLFTVFGPLKKYHEGELIKGLFFTLWRARLPEEEEWVVEGLAEAGTQLYLRDRYRRPPSLLRLLQPFSFLPVVDQILYSKSLPLRQVYFKETTPIVPREDLGYYNNPRPDGSTMLFKLTTLLGQETVDATFRRYVEQATQGEPRPFRTVAEEITGRDLDWFYRQWLSVNPSTDYAIAAVDQERKPDGYHTTLKLTKTGEGIEPLVIRLFQRRNPPVGTTWLSYEDTFEETFVTPRPVTIVQLDPDLKTSDFDRFNNRHPPALKFILEKFPGISYDLQTKNLSYDFSAYFQRRYDEDNLLRLSYSRDDTSTSAQVGLSHSYDKKLFSHPTRQSITVGAAYSKQTIPLPNSPSTSPFTTLRFTHVLSNAKTPLIYPEEIQQLFFGTIPYSSLSTTFSQKVLESQRALDRALKLRLDVRRQWALATLHEVAGRFTAGQSVGGLREERRFDLGGGSGMRGYSPTNLSGEAILLGSVEYRYPIFRYFEKNLGGITLLRRLQGAFFVDAGSIPSYPLVLGAGVGIRLTHDLLGLYPVIARFDIAFPINTPENLKPEEQNPHFYITAGQPF